MVADCVSCLECVLGLRCLGIHARLGNCVGFLILWVWGKRSGEEKVRS